MITLQVPTFDEFCDYKFVKFVKIKVKNKPSTDNYNKLIRLLPGMPQGGTAALEKLIKTREPIDVSHFYDIRQGGKSLNKLKGHYVTIVD